MFCHSLGLFIPLSTISFLALSASLRHQKRMPFQSGLSVRFCPSVAINIGVIITKRSLLRSSKNYITFCSTKSSHLRCSAILCVISFYRHFAPLALANLLTCLYQSYFYPDKPARNRYKIFVDISIRPHLLFRPNFHRLPDSESDKKVGQKAKLHKFFHGL